MLLLHSFVRAARVCVLFVLLLLACLAAAAQEQGGPPESWRAGLRWRCIGPASMGGRIGSLAVVDQDPSTYWVGTASGGLLKTTNNGVTFEHQFDRETTVSVGDVCVAPSDPNVVWVGTGENNPRNSVSYGDGVYKSTDGGKSWTNVGLRRSFQIGKILIHPKHPDTVYVGALGRLYGESEERGLYKTTDGGKTWQRVLFVDNRTGVQDMRMDPRDPDTLIVAMWDRQRDEFDSHVGEPPLADGYDGYDPARKWGPGSAIWKTTNAGRTWKKLTRGLPSSHLGRVGLDWYRKDPKIVFAIVDCARIGMGTPPPPQPYLGVIGENTPGGARLNQVIAGGPAQRAGLQEQDVIVAVDERVVPSYDTLLELVRARKVGDPLRLSVSRGTERVSVELTLGARPVPGNQGPNRNRPWLATLAGQPENIQNQQGPNGHEYGGVYKSTDGGESWMRINSLNPRPMYFSQVRVDPSDDQHVYVLGVSLYRSSDGGKTFRPDGGRGVHADQHALWINPRDGRHMLVGCDGGTYVTYDRMENWDHLNHAAIAQFYHVAIDARRPYQVYGGLQDNGSWGGPSQGLRGVGPINEDWISVGAGDGFVCRVDAEDPEVVYSESQGGAISRRNLRTGQIVPLRPTPPQGQRHRFNWNTPFLLSQHSPRVFYSAGEFVFRSLNRGDNLRIVSPEITRTKRGSATALAESPRNPDVLWVGSDDGALWVTRDGTRTWTSVADKVGLPGPRWVATIETSRAAEGRAYVVFDGHRSDDDEPYVAVTEDYGQTWKSLRANLPWGSTRVLCEDPTNPNVLYLGTEFGVWTSTDRGVSWWKLGANFPTVAVHEFAFHPTSGEMVAATHGRSLWVLDLTPLRQWDAAHATANGYLYVPAPGIRWRTEPRRGGGGSRRYIGENPPAGAQLYYCLGRNALYARLEIQDVNGSVIRQLSGPTRSGLHRVAWDLAGTGPAARASRAPVSAAPNGPVDAGEGEPETPPATPGVSVRGGRGARGGSTGGPGGGAATFPRPVPPGTYRVVLTVDGEQWSQTVRVEADPTLPVSTVPVEEEERTLSSGREG